MKGFMLIFCSLLIAFGATAQSKLNSINHRDRNEIGQRITIPRLFVIDSTSVIPDSIILNFGTHSIISNVKYKKSKPFVLSTSDR